MDDELFRHVRKVVEQSSTVEEAGRKLHHVIGRPLNPRSIRAAFSERGLESPSNFLRGKRQFFEEDEEDPPPTVRSVRGNTAPPQAQSYWERQSGGESPGDVFRAAAKVKGQAPPPPTNEFTRLVEIAKKGPHGFADLCDALDVSPKRAREMIDAAQKAGYYIEVTPGGHVGWRAPVIDDVVVETNIMPIVGQRQVVGVISDTHLGSKYCLRDQLKDFVHAAYERGAREILHPGDVVDGDYKHGRFELTHHGLEDQTHDLFETMPKLPGLKYYFIEGNHDNTFTDRSGLSSGRYIQDYFYARGRRDWQCVGNRGAFLRVRGAIFNLWHPRSGGAYALSYPLQRYVEKISSSYKPQAVLAGHWHTHVSMFVRGIHAIACPTFQGGGSAFGRSLGGQPAIGGLILSWGQTEHGTLREFDLSYRAYFEREQLVTFGDEPITAR